MTEPSKKKGGARIGAGAKPKYGCKTVTMRVPADMVDEIKAFIYKKKHIEPIKPFLIANKAEVKRMCITEYDEARTFADQKEEGRAEGRAEDIAEGIAEGRKEGKAEGREEERNTIRSNMRKAGFSDEQIKIALGE